MSRGDGLRMVYLRALVGSGTNGNNGELAEREHLRS